MKGIKHKKKLIFICGRYGANGILPGLNGKTLNFDLIPARNDLGLDANFMI